MIVYKNKKQKEEQRQGPIIQKIQNKVKIKKIFAVAFAGYSFFILFIIYGILPNLLSPPYVWYILLGYSIVSCPLLLDLGLNLSNLEGAIFYLSSTVKSLSLSAPEKAGKATKSFDLMIVCFKNIIDEYKELPYTESIIKTLEELLNELRQRIYPILEDKKEKEYGKLAESLICLRGALIKKDINGLENYMNSLMGPLDFVKQDRKVAFPHEIPAISSKFNILFREIMKRLWDFLNNDPVVSRFIPFFIVPFLIYLLFIGLTGYEFNISHVLTIFLGSAALTSVRR